MRVPHDTRDQVVAFVNYWAERTEIYAAKSIHWLGTGSSRFFDWKRCYGKVNELNAWILSDFSLED